MDFIYIFINAIILFITAFYYIIYLYFQRSFNYWLNRSIPHLKPSFPFGNVNRNVMTESGMIIRDIYNKLRATGATYCGYHMFAMPFFMPLTPDLYKEILIKNFHCFPERGIFYDEENDPMSAHMGSLPGAKWKKLRTKLSPAFSSGKLKMMFKIMKQYSAQIPALLEESDTIEIHDLTTRFTADIICSCAFGIDGNSLKNPDSEFRRCGRNLIELNFFDSTRFVLGIMAPEILIKFKISFFNPKITNFLYNIVQETVEYREKNNVRKNDVMDMLIRLKNNEVIDDTDTNNINKNEEDEELTLNQIAAQVFFFFLAGFETTATTLTFCMYELSRHLDIQDKVREEILDVLLQNDGDVTYEVVNNMPYTDKVIQEVLRLYPPLLTLNRICVQRFQLPNSTLTIDEGMRVVISTLGVHYDPEFYPNPHVFDPERFSDEEKAKRPPMTYFPFGDGPRICIGPKFALMEIKLGLVMFLKNYRYSVDSLTRQEIRTVCNGILLGLKDKIWLKSTKI